MKQIYLIIIASLLFSCASAQLHPTLIVAEDDVQDIKAVLGQYPLWDATVTALAEDADAALAQVADVPVPVDPAGGYTHEKHKANGQMLKKLGLQYQLTGDAKYVDYAKDVFIQYATMYPTLELHPVDKSYARGKLFWQQLNEAVFLCDAIEGYDAIYLALSKKERKFIEENFLLEIADFLSVETPYVFNKIHNHGVWAAAAVGMTGMALDNEELVARAFYGIDEDGKPMQKNVDGFGDSPYGFFTMTSSLFSPDGYYTEGPYYQRYAMTPFLLFAQSINQSYPEMGVFDYQDQILIKAVETLVDLTDANGEFFPINDHLKGMGLQAPSMVWAMDFLYARTKNPQILSIAEKQGTRSISMGGMEIARGLAQGENEAIDLQSKLITDGNDGKAGGLGILRSEGLTTVFKYASHGMNHGHFDRLNIIHYDNGNEVLRDYGAARFVNVKAKEGGRYLPENDTYAKQTVAHNTVVINAESQFEGNYKNGKDSHANLLFAELDDENIQLLAAYDNEVYADAKLLRIVAQVKMEDYEKPVLLDVFVVDAEGKNQLDLPYHFNGEIIDSHFEMKAETTVLNTLGEGHGYEHIWKIASGETTEKNAGLTWMQKRKFYSITTLSNENTELIYTRIGANDPHFNLRTEPAFIVRQTVEGQHVFASVIEAHGYNNANTEIVSNQEKMTAKLRASFIAEDVVRVDIESKLGNKSTLLIRLSDDAQKTFDIEAGRIEVVGNYKFITK